MASDPYASVWAKLEEALVELVIGCRGTFAAVVDEGNGLWRVGRAPSLSSHVLEEERAADRFYRAEIAPRAQSLRRGVRLSVMMTEGDDRYIAESFASIYAVIVWFGGPFEPDFTRARLRRALPRIEALTLSLPPNGPGSHDGRDRERA